MSVIKPDHDQQSHIFLSSKLLDLFNRLLIHLITPVMMTNSPPLYEWQKQHPDKAIVQHIFCLPQCFI
jgi:hypothetical protein